MDSRALARHSITKAARALGISKSTLLRWEEEKRIEPPPLDRNGWRFFTDEAIAKIRELVEAPPKGKRKR